MRLRYLRPLAALTLLCLLSTAARADLEIDWRNNENPYLREAQMDIELGNYFSAIGHLLAERHRGTFGKEQSKAELMLVYAYLKYGMHSEAAGVLQPLPVEKRYTRYLVNLLLELATMRYQRGYLDGAQQILEVIDEGRMSYPQLEQKYNLSALILLQQDKTQDAINVLSAIRDTDAWGLVGKFNLGTAMIRRNMVKSGREMLESVAGEHAGTPELQALRDRVFYTLGFLDLQTMDLANARTHFQSVQLDSPFANRAMLGLGIAHAATGDHADAINVWRELAKRNSSDPSVLEALLAIPMSLTELGDHSQSIDSYQKALDTFRSEIRRIDSLTEDVKKGALIEVLLQKMLASGEGVTAPDAIPALPEFQYLRGLYESHAFQVAVNNYRDLRLMEQRLRAWADNIYKIPDMSRTFKKVYVDKIAAQQSTLTTAAAELKQHISKLALAELSKRKQQVISYSKQALFAMAQNYDTSAFKSDLN